MNRYKQNSEKSDASQTSNSKRKQYSSEIPTITKRRDTRIKSQEQKTPEKIGLFKKAQSAIAQKKTDKTKNTTEKVRKSLNKALNTHEELKNTIQELFPTTKTNKTTLLKNKQDFSAKLGKLHLKKLGDKLVLESEKVVNLDNLEQFDKSLQNNKNLDKISTPK